MSRKRNHNAAGFPAPATEGALLLAPKPTEPERSEVEKLQLVLEKALSETSQLRIENRQWEERCTKAQESQKSLREEADRLKREANKQKLAQQKSARALMTANVRLERLQARYDALAGSKLGRLTLTYWAWQKGRRKTGGGLGNTFLFQWLFQRLPPLEIADSPALPPLASPKQIAPAQVVSPSAASPQAPEISPEQAHWAERYTAALSCIDDSNGTRFYQKLPYRIGLVCDEFFYESISAAADFVFLTPDNWEAVVAEGLDVLLFVSAWRGLHGQWRGLASLSQLKENPKRAVAKAMLERCREKGIPTVFYSKEDPPNYELFLDFAKVCDYVFTSARECVPYYESDCGKEHVEAVCFGINPLYHNPIGFHQGEKEDCVLFSGSWMRKYPDRCKELAVIFDGILDAGHALHIIDRNYPDNPAYRFPNPYFQYVSPALDHDTLQKIHKRFDWAVNINSVKGSETMFANRAFELQANGVLLLSNFSVGVNSILPSVQMVYDASEVAGIMSTMSADARYERQIAGIRSVMTGHSCFDRIAQLLGPTGLSAAQPVRRILVLADTLTAHVEESFARQTYPDKALFTRDALTPEQLAAYDMVAWFAPDADYGVYYLEDLANGFKYTACDYITKDAWCEADMLHSGAEHQYVSAMGSKYRTLFWREAFSPAFLLELDGAQSLANGYSIDHFNYNAAPLPRPDSRPSGILCVIVPVYNNGAHLLGKCFASLQRSSLFDRMEIILVDDGSDDDRTLKAEQYLEEKFQNVRSFRFTDGGSGSASRPRNKGVELATAPYLTFLDPDNEAICDGYAQLLQAAQEDDLDLALGNMYKCTTDKYLSNYYGTIVSAAGTDSFRNGFGTSLTATGFLSASIQAMVIKTALIRKNHLTQVPGAAGQDTLFSWQLLQAAQRIQVLDVPIHIYYAQTAGSVTNSVSAKFFRKLLLLQQPKADWLRESGLMRSFMESRYDYYTTHWVFQKLSQAREDCVQECAMLVEQILAVYAAEYRRTDPLINQYLAYCSAGDYAAAVACVQQAFPLQQKRPMPTLKEILQAAKKPTQLQVTYRQSGSAFTFLNTTRIESGLYAWVVLDTSGAYQKMVATKYHTRNTFTCDFSAFAPGRYKVRAFLKNKDAKVSEDVAYLDVTAQGVSLLQNLSNVVKAQA
ncbi:MAG: glycosyltransferase [Oscillospiraceae bacterium]|nr:glycosyltransferase [Oscillospiraceae bacterium]